MLAHFQFFQARESTIKLYSEKQTILAQQVALSIEKFFIERINALELIARNIGVGQHDKEKYVEGFKNTFNMIGSYESLFLCDRIRYRIIITWLDHIKETQATAGRALQINLQEW